MAQFSVNTERFTDPILLEKLLATDIADYLVLKGLPFRQAHSVVGELINFTEENNCLLAELALDQLKQFSPYIDAEIYAVLDQDDILNKKQSDGACTIDEVRQLIIYWEDRI